MLEKDFLQLASSLPEGLILLSAQGQILALNKEAVNFFLRSGSGQSPVGSNLQDFIHCSPETFTETLRFWRRSRTPIPARIDWKFLDKQEMKNITCQGFLLQPESKTTRAQLVLRCVTGRSFARDFIALNNELNQQKGLLKKLMTSRAMLELEHEKALTTLHSIGDAVITTDAQTIVEYLNPVAEEFTGWRCDDAKGKKISEVFDIINEITREVAPDPVERCIKEGRIVGLANHTVLKSIKGVEYVIEDSAAPIRNNLGKILGAVLVFRNTTDERLALRQLKYLAQHDTLTGLKNRYYFEQQLQHTVDLCSRGKHQAALLYVDLDQFKIINDTAGHAAGDELLIEVARKFTQRVRQGDILARLGGDEFGVILSGVKPNVTKDIARSFVDSLSDFKFSWDNEKYNVTCSIGATYIDKNVKSSAEVMRLADIACYIAKDEGRNKCHLYNASDTQKVPQLGEMKLVGEIRSALSENRFLLHFQPIRDLKNKDNLLFEVLLRLQQEDGSIIRPGNFIPTAERHGLMTAIDQWVITNSIRLLSEKCKKHKTINFTVNLSGSSLGDRNILGVLEQFATESPKIAQQLILEITETSAITQMDKACTFIQKLRAMGIRFGLDDFGTGFSSFSYLKQLQIDYVKIDGIFVSDVVDDESDQAMVRSVNQIAQSLQKKTIAEFVENQEILDFIESVGVDMVQGYFIGKPDADIEKYLELVAAC